MKHIPYAIQLKKHFKLKKANVKQDKNIQIRCPYHDDKTPSASINLGKGVFQCFKDSCVGGKSLRQLCLDLNLEVKVKRDVEEQTETKSKKIPIRSLEAKAKRYLRERGFDPNKIEVTWDIVTEYKKEDGEIHPFYGYLVFESLNGAVVGRNILGDDRPKYKNLTGPKDVFVLARDKSSRVVWIVEGIFDGLSLVEAGIKNVIVNRGSNISYDSIENLCYSLRKNTVIILFDNDPSGFIGAKDLAVKLREYEVDHDIPELPSQFKDPNDAWVRDRKTFVRFIRSKEEKYFHTDELFIESFLKEDKPLNIISTGISQIDRAMSVSSSKLGGYKEGYHILSGTTESGKTSIITNTGVKAALDNKIVLINSCEISKRQMWSRVASIFDKKSWSVLEENPKLMSPKTKQILGDLSSRLRIVFNWPLEKIMVEADRYDLIIIDYIQRMGEVYGGDLNASRFFIDKVTSRLSALSEFGVVSLVVSALDRASYNNPRSFGLKESGGLEYAAASVSRITKISDEGIIWDIQKSTRGGQRGQIKLSNIDLGHCKFGDKK